MYEYTPIACMYKTSIKLWNLNKNLHQKTFVNFWFSFYNSVHFYISNTYVFTYKGKLIISKVYDDDDDEHLLILEVNV